MRHWLVKSEPDAFSFEELLAAPGRSTLWDGVRNYQARNFMRDEMRVGDPILFYHSGARPAVVGLAEVASEPCPDPSQFDPSSRYFDPKASELEPRWQAVEVRALRPLARPIALDELRREPELAGMQLLQRGNRLSVMPVEPRHFERILDLAEEPAPDHRE